VEVEKEWLIDTGAAVSVITKDNAEQFDLTATGATTSGTTGGGGIIMKSGLTMVFTVLGRDGTNREVTCSLDVGVKHNNAGSEIIGMDQVNEVGAEVIWNPGTRDGDVREPREEPPSGDSGGGWT
jgi:hypothetical protein